MEQEWCAPWENLWRLVYFAQQIFKKTVHTDKYIFLRWEKANGIGRSCQVEGRNAWQKKCLELVVP